MKSKILIIINYALSLFIFLAGIGLFEKSIVAGVLYLMAAFLIFNKSYSFIVNFTVLKLLSAKFVRPITILIILGIATSNYNGIAYKQESDNFLAKKDSIYEEAKSLSDSEKYNDVVKLLKEPKTSMCWEYGETNEDCEKLTNLIKEAKIKIAEIQKIEQEKIRIQAKKELANNKNSGNLTSLPIPPDGDYESVGECMMYLSLEIQNHGYDYLVEIQKKYHTKYKGYVSRNIYVTDNFVKACLKPGISNNEGFECMKQKGATQNDIDYIVGMLTAQKNYSNKEWRLYASMACTVIE
jgi:hypothetical protein